MKKWLDKIWILFTLTLGYGLVALGLFAVVLLLGYFLIQLIYLNIDEPSLLLALADIVALGAFVFAITRKKVREGIPILLKQISKNM